jgi:hypothetical protein
LVIFKQKESSVEVTILHGSLRRFPSILYDQIVLDLNNFCLFFYWFCLFRIVDF